ncbi:hypothetical protein LIER_19007 [Lithospermum erythrorhizon]|uniref:Reverse transcriptase RNase H-like domain-containing protein n=1 Tax=Lithospermum erythrorhizon TaxID=34254 RepID=A0AAV3QIE8_LITER
MIIQRGIEPNPDKFSGVQAMQSPKTQNQAQRLIGRIAALTRFISRAGDRSLPFFKAINKGVLIREEDRVQKPVYYVSRVMRGVETRYPLTEKLVYAFTVEVRKL